MIKGISANVLKIIAIITMLIDHVAFYMFKNFSYTEYCVLRGIGRLAMPIFAYLLVQGFFYTKNLKKYITRIFIVALITQIGLSVVGYLNQKYFVSYVNEISCYMTVLFSYFSSLLLIMIIDKKIIIEKLGIRENVFARIIVFILIMSFYFTLNIEFGLQVPIMVLGFYIIEKVFQKNNQLLLKRKITKKNKLIYILLIELCIMLSVFFMGKIPPYINSIFLSALIIAIYNGEHGNKNKFIQYLFYMIFPIQHIALYLLAMI